MTGAHDVAEERRVPARAEVATMLSTYFVGPITDATIDKLHAEVVGVLADSPLHAGMSRGFEPGNGGKGFGCAWREDLAFERGRPRSIDLAAWIAWSQPGYPPARPYCPDGFVGTWVQQQPPAPALVRWVLERDGAFSAPGTPFAERIGWCVHRQGPKADDASLWLSDRANVAVKRLNVWSLTPTELELEPTTGPKIRLERA